MDFKKLKEQKVGAVIEKVMGVSKKNGKITMNDINNKSLMLMERNNLRTLI